MLKILKTDNILKYNIDENIEIPNDFAKAQEIALETLGWIVFMKITSVFNKPDKFSTVLHKTFCLLFKIVLAQNPDLSNLTTNEQTIVNNIQNVLNTNYTDSQLVATASQELVDAINWYNTKESELLALTTVDEIKTFLVSLNNELP